MAKKKPNKTIQQYNRIRSQLNRQIRGMEKRGYFFEKPQVPAKPKKITAASVRRLRKIKSELYEKARFRTQEGTVTSGKRGRYLERSRAGSKAARTRKYGALPENTVDAVPVTYDRLWEIINVISGVHPNSAKFLQNLVAAELSLHGSDPAEQYKQQIRICNQFEEAEPAHIELLAVIAYYRRGTDTGQKALNELTMIIKGGEIPSAEQMAEISSIFYEDDDGFIHLEDMSDIPFE